MTLEDTHFPRRLPAGWYPEYPSGRVRYWDGAAWTEHANEAPLRKGWYHSPGQEFPRFWDGSNWTEQAPLEDWKRILSNCRSVREAINHPALNGWMRRFARQWAASLPNPWLPQEQIMNLANSQADRVTRQFVEALPRRLAKQPFVNYFHVNAADFLSSWCYTEVVTRQALLRQHDPEARSAAGNAFQAAGPAPSPAPFGVSNEGAELLCRAWMVHLGEADASVTRYSGDGGIDVESAHYVAQVKNYGASQFVPVSAVRELAGVASVTGRRPLFFTSGLYTREAEPFASSVRMALFRYNAEDGTLVGENPLAQRYIKIGL